MIIVDGSSNYMSREESHISVPDYSYAMTQSSRSLTSKQMRKVSDVYVGNEHIYPELFCYTLKYHMRLGFSFHGNSYGFDRQVGAYAEAETEGYIDETVRLDTVFPVYIKEIPLVAPPDLYVPFAQSHPVLSQPPWGYIEQYREFGGTEYIITPACALTYDLFKEKYADEGLAISSSGDRMGYRIIVDRVINSHTVHPVMRNWDNYDNEEEYWTNCHLQARQTNAPYRNQYQSPKITINKGSYVPLVVGFYSRPGINGSDPIVFLVTNMDHSFSMNNVLLGAPTPAIYGYRQAGDYIGGNALTYSLAAPMFSGHKHFNNYDSGYNYGRQEITSWEDPQMDEWGHTDLDGSFTILENNNPKFDSFRDYLKAYRS